MPRRLGPLPTLAKKSKQQSKLTSSVTTSNSRSSTSLRAFSSLGSSAEATACGRGGGRGGTAAAREGARHRKEGEQAQVPPASLHTQDGTPLQPGAAIRAHTASPKCLDKAPHAGCLDAPAPPPGPAAAQLLAQLQHSTKPQQAQPEPPTCASSWPSHRLPITAGKPPSIALYTPAAGRGTQGKQRTRRAWHAAERGRGGVHGSRRRRHWPAPLGRVLLPMPATGGRKF